MKDFSKFFAVENTCEKIAKISVITGVGALGLGMVTSLAHDVLERREIKKQNKLITNNNKGGQR